MIVSSDLSSLLLQAFASSVSPKSAIYCSCPITSGRRNLEWLRKSGLSFVSIDEASPHERAEHAKEVIAANCEHASGIVARLRRASKQVVIDPTSFPPVVGWTQPEWLGFWTSVIERYASAVVFLDEWEFSNGCCHEFLAATNLSLPTFDEHGMAISGTRAISLLETAIAELRDLSGPTVSQERVLHALRQSATGDRAHPTRLLEVSF